MGRLVRFAGRLAHEGQTLNLGCRIVLEIERKPVSNRVVDDGFDARMAVV